jgi:4'-phosphopantetheinyl transferase EntD
VCPSISQGELGVPGVVWASAAIVEAAPGDADWARLPPAEAAYGRGLKGDKRRREWFAGRSAARDVLRALGAPDAALLPDDEGAPVLHDVDPARVEGLEVSLSHGGRWALCAGHRRAKDGFHLGVDLVDDGDAPRAARVLDRHLSDGERALLAALSNDDDRARAAALMWGAREAVAKATRTGMFAFALLDVHVTALDLAAGRVEVDYPGCALGVRHLLPGTTLVWATVTADAAKAAQAAADRRRQGA